VPQYITTKKRENLTSEGQCERLGKCSDTRGKCIRAAVLTETGMHEDRGLPGPTSPSRTHNSPMSYGTFRLPEQMQQNIVGLGFFSSF